VSTTALDRDAGPVSGPVRHAFTVDEYCRMAEAGVTEIPSSLRRRAVALSLER
jgi:hypothetical protein